MTQSPKKSLCHCQATAQELIENLLQGTNVYWQADGLDDLHPFPPVGFSFSFLFLNYYYYYYYYDKFLEAGTLSNMLYSS